MCDYCDQIIADVILYINENYHSKIRLDDIANKFHFSKQYISKSFKAIAGKGINEYLMELKICKAEELLASSNMKMHDIAQYLGFSDESHFIKTFKKVKKVSPGIYRSNTLR